MFVCCCLCRFGMKIWVSPSAMLWPWVWNSAIHFQTKWKPHRLFKDLPSYFPSPCFPPPSGSENQLAYEIKLREYLYITENACQRRKWEYSFESVKPEGFDNSEFPIPIPKNQNVKIAIKNNPVFRMLLVLMKQGNCLGGGGGLLGFFLVGWLDFVCFAKTSLPQI